MKAILSHKPANLLALLGSLIAILATDEVLSILPPEWTPYIMGLAMLFAGGSGWRVPSSGDTTTRPRPSSTQDMLDRTGKTMLVLLALVLLPSCATRVASTDFVEARIQGETSWRGETLVTPDSQEGDWSGDGWLDAKMTVEFCLNRTLSFKMCAEANVGFRIEHDGDDAAIAICWDVADGAVEDCYIIDLATAGEQAAE